MKDPVVDPGGHSYERAAIEKWLESRRESPVTRAPLRRAQLAPNFALRQAIEEFLQSKAVDGPPKLMSLHRSDLDGQDRGDAKDHVLYSTRILCAEQQNGSTLALVSVVPPAGKRRVPVDICCVVDISGSMSAEATVKNQKGKSERHGLTLLDIVKHAVQTIIDTLGPDDRLALVAYSTAADVTFGLMTMDRVGKARAKQELQQLEAAGTTNLWDGLRLGMVFHPLY